MKKKPVCPALFVFCHQAAQYFPGANRPFMKLAENLLLKFNLMMEHRRKRRG